MNKTFKGDLLLLKEKLLNKEPFAFNRFSDGELFILKNQELILGEGIIKMGEVITVGPYQKEDHKHFDPKKHQFFRESLTQAFRFSKKNYFKGICCKCCASVEDYKWQLEYMQNGNDEYLTWANLWVNSNYPNFLSEVFPCFFNYNTVILCNEKANLKRFPFIVKDFRVGSNAMINNYNVIEEMKNWINKNNIKNHLFLFSASSLSKVAIHQLYEFNDQNTYIDIGTTLNLSMDLRLDRGYLQGYWLGHSHPDIKLECIW